MKCVTKSDHCIRNGRHWPSTRNIASCKTGLKAQFWNAIRLPTDFFQAGTMRDLHLVFAQFNCLANSIAHQNVVKNSFCNCLSSAPKLCFKLLDQLYKSPSSWYRHNFLYIWRCFWFQDGKMCTKIFHNPIFCDTLWHFQNEKWRSWLDSNCNAHPGSK